MTTRWSLVLQAQGTTTSAEVRLALSELCEAYWLPLYAFVRRQVDDTDEAQDVTQAFFTQLLSKRFLNDVEQERGRFRSFLLAAVKHFLSNERHKARTLKRGGHVVIQSLDWQQGEERLRSEPTNDMTPERLFDRQWALALLDRVLQRLRAEYRAANREAIFEGLSPFLSTDRDHVNYADAASRLNVSDGTARVAAHRLRRRYRQMLRDEIAHTTSTTAEADAELRELFAALKNRS